MYSSVKITLVHLELLNNSISRISPSPADQVSKGYAHHLFRPHFFLHKHNCTTLNTVISKCDVQKKMGNHHRQCRHKRYHSKYRFGGGERDPCLHVLSPQVDGIIQKFKIHADTRKPFIFQPRQRELMVIYTISCQIRIST